MSEYEAEYLKPEREPFSVYLSKWWRRNKRRIYFILGIAFFFMLGVSGILDGLFVLEPSSNPNPDPFPWWFWFILFSG